MSISDVNGHFLFSFSIPPVVEIVAPQGKMEGAWTRPHRHVPRLWYLTAIKDVRTFSWLAYNVLSWNLYSCKLDNKKMMANRRETQKDKNDSFKNG